MFIRFFEDRLFPRTAQDAAQVTAMVPSHTNGVTFDAQNSTVLPQVLSHADLDKSTFGKWTSYVGDKASEIYTHYIEPTTKAQIDSMIVNSIGFSAYASLTSMVGVADASAFMTRAKISIGFKLFNAVANPLMAQFVESFTEMHMNNAKYVYYKAKCIISNDAGQMPDNLPTSFTNDLNEKSTLINDFTQFDVKRYITEVSQGLDDLSIKKLALGGTLSAMASSIRDTIYEQTGLEPYTKGYLFKNWINYYFKDWIKDELHSEVNKLNQMAQEKLGLQDIVKTSPDTTTAPLSFNDIITQENHPILTPQNQPVLPVAPMIDLNVMMPLVPVIES